MKFPVSVVTVCVMDPVSVLVGDACVLYDRGGWIGNRAVDGSSVTLGKQRGQDRKSEQESEHHEAP